MDSHEAAKALFLKYSGSHFQMDREGEYERYSSFHVPKEQERAWAEEQEQALLAKVDHETDAYRIECLVSGLDFYFFNYPVSSLISQALDVIRSKEPLVDSFGKVLISERLLRIVEHSSRSGIRPDVTDCAKRVASDFLQSVLDNPVTVAPAYLALGYPAGLLSEERIRLRAAKDLGRIGANKEKTWGGAGS